MLGRQRYVQLGSRVLGVFAVVCPIHDGYIDAQKKKSERPMNFIISGLYNWVIPCKFNQALLHFVFDFLDMLTSCATIIMSKCSISQKPLHFG